MRRWDRETALVAQFAACVSFISFAYYFQHGDLLLYGDAVAHINIARRVFDSRTPGSAATRHRVAAAAASADDSISAFRLGVAIGHRRFHSFDGRLCVGRGGHLPPGAERAELSIPQPDLAARIAAWIERNHLRRESQSDLPANHGHDRVVVPGAVHLGSGVLQRVCAGNRRGTSAAGAKRRPRR